MGGYKPFTACVMQIYGTKIWDFDSLNNSYAIRSVFDDKGNTRCLNVCIILIRIFRYWTKDTEIT